MAQKQVNVIMRRIALLLLLLCTLARGAEGLRIMLEVHEIGTVDRVITERVLGDGPKDGSIRLVNVFIKNDGPSHLRVALGGLGPSSRSDEDGFSVSYVGEFKKNAKGDWLVLPESDLRIVDLRKGEAAWVGTVEDRKRIEQSRQLEVEYVIPLEWGERYGIWAGKIAIEGRIVSAAGRVTFVQDAGCDPK